MDSRSRPWTSTARFEFALAVALASVALVMLTGPTAFGSKYTGDTGDDEVDVHYIDEDGNDVTNDPDPTKKTGPNVREEQWVASPVCVDERYRADLSYRCASPADEIEEECLDGSEALPPWWMRWRIGNNPWSGWAIQGWYRCPDETDLESEIREAWASMTITPNVINVQPDTGWTITTVPTIFYVDRAPRTQTVTLLGTDVIIRALPSTYRWRWGDGSGPTVTSSPGAPYPNQTVTHTYLRDEREVTVRLETTWTGQFSIDGGSSWIAAPGIATTDSVPVDIYVYNPHSHQVDCDLDGYCITDQ